MGPVKILGWPPCGNSNSALTFRQTARLSAHYSAGGGCLSASVSWSWWAAGAYLFHSWFIFVFIGFCINVLIEDDCMLYMNRIFPWGSHCPGAVFCGTRTEPLIKASQHEQVSLIKKSVFSESIYFNFKAGRSWASVWFHLPVTVYRWISIHQWRWQWHQNIVLAPSRVTAVCPQYR